MKTKLNAMLAVTLLVTCILSFYMQPVMAGTQVLHGVFGDPGLVLGEQRIFRVQTASLSKAARDSVNVSMEGIHFPSTGGATFTVALRPDAAALDTALVILKVEVATGGTYLPADTLYFTSAVRWQTVTVPGFFSGVQFVVVNDDSSLTGTGRVLLDIATCKQ